MFDFHAKVDLLFLDELLDELLYHLEQTQNLGSALQQLQEDDIDPRLQKQARKTQQLLAEGSSLGVAIGQISGRYRQIAEKLLTPGLSVADTVQCLKLLRAVNRQEIDSNRWLPALFKLSGLIYLFVLITVLAIIVLFVMPGFAEIYASVGADLPNMTRLVMQLSELIVSHFFIGCVIVIAVLAVYFRSGFVRRRIDKMALSVPSLGNHYKSISANKVFLFLQAAQKQNQPVAVALEMAVYSLKNRYLRGQLYALSGCESYKELLAQLPFAPSRLKRLVRRDKDWHKTSSPASEYMAQWSDHLSSKSTILYSRLDLVMKLLGFTIVSIFIVAIYLPIIRLGEVV